MKLIKGIFAIAVISVIAFSCDQPKKEAATEVATEAVEAVDKAATEATEATTEAVEQAVDSVLESNERLARQIKLFVCHSYSGKRLREIGKRFSVSESAVTQASRRTRDKLKNDKKLEKLIMKVVKKLYLSNV